MRLIRYTILAFLLTTATSVYADVEDYQLGPIENEKPVTTPKKDKTKKPVSSSQKDAPTKWNSDLESSLAIAKDCNRPILIVFHAAWCIPCQEMRQTLSSKPVQNQIAGKYVLAYLDYDASKSAVQQYGVTSIPTTIVCNTAGSILFRYQGKMIPSEFTHWLETKENSQSKPPHYVPTSPK